MITSELDALRHLVQLLGWFSISRCDKTIDDRTYVWYEWRDDDGCCIQFNQSPIGQSEVWEVCAYCWDCNICSGWHEFTIQYEPSDIAGIAQRLENWVARRYFCNPTLQVQYSAMHPECVGIMAGEYPYSWKKRHV